ncbi:MAG: uncharacterized protein PWP08_846 [Methanofollis sp.]|nr:uncharacterized protein [Methanofollis sp.]
MILTAFFLPLILTGLLVGALSGLLGVGGGFIMVPILLWLYTSMGLPEEIALRLALGTSLAAIIPTAISGALGHHRRGSVAWRPGCLLGVSAAAGGIVGAVLATHLPPAAVRIFFGLVVFAAGIRILIPQKTETRDDPENRDGRYLAWGFPVGVVSGLAGIGGGVVLIPVLTSVLRFGMLRAVATSTVVMVFAASAGTLSYMIAGIGVSGLPPGTIGYVGLLQAVVLMAVSMPAAQFGVAAAHRLPPAVLRAAFVLLTGYLGLRMMGFFSFLGLPF